MLSTFAIAVTGTTGCSRFKKKKAPTTEQVPGELEGAYPAVGDLGAGLDPGEMSAYPESPRMPADMQIAELRTVYFDYDSSELNATNQQILDANLQYLQANSSLSIQVEGHCDERGTREYNYALGQRRADAVRNYLISRGIDASRLNAISYGEDRPVAPGSGEEA